MHVVTIADLKKEPMGTATPIAGSTGGAVSRSRQTIIPDGDSEDYRCSVVNFEQGATTGWHAHTCDQILIVTGGSGIVATEQEEREIAVGDVVHIKAGERHWHGAKANTTLAHITITTPSGESRR
jgi:quercetin dioxygenase-like cupin family protein